MPNKVDDTSLTPALDVKGEPTGLNTEGTSQETSHINAIIVDWDGPDDPSNPKK